MTFSDRNAQIHLWQQCSYRNSNLQNGLGSYLNAPATDAVWGATTDFPTGFGQASMMIFVVRLFERKSTRYLLINAGYATFTLTLMGWLIGAWR